MRSDWKRLNDLCVYIIVTELTYTVGLHIWCLSALLFMNKSVLNVNNLLMITVRCLQVESLTAARKSALNGQEPSDAIRVVNAFLTQIDQIKRYFKNKFSYGPASPPFNPKSSPVQIHVNFDRPFFAPIMFAS